MRVTAKRLTGLEQVQEAASVTARGATVRAGIGFWAETEHSPLRAYLWQVDLQGIPYRASVHLVRHKVGVEHYVSTTRPDLAPNGGEDSKSAPVNHTMVANAQALITMARSRLCYKAHAQTVNAMRRIRDAVAEQDPELARWLRPECVYRHGYCPERRECRPGLARVLQLYGVHQVCHWHWSTDHQDWETGCGNAHAFPGLDSRPGMHGYRYCPYCGSALVTTEKGNDND